MESCELGVHEHTQKHTKTKSERGRGGGEGPNINAIERHRQKMFCFNEVTTYTECFPNPTAFLQ